MPPTHRNNNGVSAENRACHFLLQQGLLLITKNFRCPHGEIDLIMQDIADIVFIEVRLRKNISYGTAVESVNFLKQQRLIKTGRYFLQAKKWLYQKNSRFDVIAIHPIQGKMQLEWIKNAFTVDHF